MRDGETPICDYEGSDYQERFWQSVDRRYEDLAEAAALRRLLLGGGDFLLEIGAGAGRHTPRYAAFERVALLDYSLSQLQRAQQTLGRGPRFLYVAADLYRMPFVPGNFDAATMIRTLHHMADPQAALEAAAEVLRSGAQFILEYANKRNLKAVLRWILRRQAWNPFDLAPVELVRLNFNFHPHAVRSWLESAGLIVESQLAVSGFRQPTLKRVVPLRALLALEAVVQPIGGWLLLSPSVFVRARMVGPRESSRTGEFWRCPQCGSRRFDERPDGLKCLGCGRLWELRDGIYDFRARPPAEPEPVGRQ
jgi:SAM-dependent methyltransferase